MKLKKITAVVLTLLCFSGMFCTSQACGNHHSTHHTTGAYCAYHHTTHKKAKSCSHYCTKHKTTHANRKCHK